jgi:hypothetical protein
LEGGGRRKVVVREEIFEEYLGLQGIGYFVSFTVAIALGLLG